MIDNIKKIFSLLVQKTKAFFTWYKKLFIGRPWYIKTVSGIASFFVFIAIYLIAVDITSYGYLVNHLDSVKSKSQLHPKHQKFIAQNGVLIGK